MKLEKIPVDIKSKSIKEAQNEIKEIITNLENTKTNLEESMDKYNRMMQLNFHIREQFKKKLTEIKDSDFDNNKKFELDVKTLKNNQKITSFYSDNAEPFVKHFKFIKGFKEGKITLPIILAHGRSNSKERKFWKKVISDLNQENHDFEEALTIINKYNCIEDTIKRAEHFGNVAIDSINVFKSDNYKECLINLMQASIKRVS